MPRYSQIKNNNPYQLPDDIYHRVIWIIKGYDRMREEYKAAIGYTPPVITGMPKDNEVYKPTEDKGILLATQYPEYHAIEQSKLMIPEAFREHVFRKLAYDEPYSIRMPVEDGGLLSIKLCESYESVLIYGVAKYLKMIQPEECL